MILKSRRMYPVVQVKEPTDEFLHFVEMPVNGDHVELVMHPQGPCMAVTAPTNAIRAKHDLYVVPIDQPFQQPLGRPMELLKTQPIRVPNGPLVYYAFYKLGPWPTSPLEGAQTQGQA